MQNAAGDRESDDVDPLIEIVNPFRWELGHVAFLYDLFLLCVLGPAEFTFVGVHDACALPHNASPVSPGSAASNKG